MNKIIIHSDGACAGNPGPGGWAAVLACGTYRKELSGGAPATTNNRMELQAALESLRTLTEPCDIQFFTDSEYLRLGITEWLDAWKARHWRTAAKQPVRNDDLWRLLDEQARRHQIHWQWVKAHAGHAENERCDFLARGEIDKIRQAYTREQLQRALAAFRARPTPLQNQLALTEFPA